jgi:hypothetical protein
MGWVLPLLALLGRPALAQEDPELAEVEPPAKVTVSVARLPLPAGKKLTFDDLTTVDLPRELVPPTAVVKGTALVGRVLAHPVAQQSAIVGQRLEGWVPPPVEVVEEGPSMIEVEWKLGPMGALVQAGDVVVWVQPGPKACRLAQGEVLRRGSPTVFEVRAEETEALKEARDPAVMLRGPGATVGSLPACRAEPAVVIEGAP